MKTKHSKAKVFAGALVGGALGLVAGMLLPDQVQKAGKKKAKEIGEDMKDMTMDFYKSSLAPRLKKMQKVGTKEFIEIMDSAVESYGKAKHLSANEVKGLRKKAEHYWRQIQKHL